MKTALFHPVLGMCTTVLLVHLLLAVPRTRWRRDVFILL